MQAIGHTGRNLTNVENKIANLAPHVVLQHHALASILDTDSELTYLVGPPTDSIRQIRIRVEQSNTVEVWKTQDHRQVVGVSDELRVVEHNEWSADSICTRREVNNCRSGRL